MASAKCPMCSASVSVPSKVKQGDIVFCEACDAELEVVNLKPLELDWPLDGEEFEFAYEDYGDDDDDYDYDDYDDED